MLAFDPLISEVVCVHNVFDIVSFGIPATPMAKVHRSSYDVFLKLCRQKNCVSNVPRLL